jgi:hypothetical protein
MIAFTLEAIVEVFSAVVTLLLSLTMDVGEY